MWKKYNANPRGRQAGDCTVRAVSRVTGKTWEDAYSGVSVYGFMLADMPSANHVWGAYLKSQGFTRHIIPDTCPDCYTVSDFCADHPDGVYLLALDGHVVAVENGDYYDTWDSGEETPIYYWQKG